MSVPVSVQLELLQAQIDAKEGIDLYGDDITFILKTESDIIRDKYNSFKRKTGSSITELSIKAYPIISNPNTRQIEKAGLLEKCDLMITTSYRDWILNSIDFNDIDIIKFTVKVSDLTYKIKEKATPPTQIGSGSLYINFGLAKD